jgi:protein-tyrosine kinase
MERIRQALERAEQNRSKSADSVSSQVKSEGYAARRDPVPREHRTVSESKFDRTKIVDVPAEVLEQNRLVAAIPGHPLTDVYRILRTRVLQSLNSNRWNSFAVTSPATGAGKTLTAINLAISLAREVNRTVLLADFDLRRPSVHQYFGYEPELGVSDYLFNDAPLEEILFSPSIDRLVVLPGRESVHNSSEMLRSPKMIDLVDELKSRYADRLVIFDLPPVLAIDDAIAFTPYTDALLLVAENGETKRDDMSATLEILKGTPIIGTVLNKAEKVSTAVYTRD